MTSTTDQNIADRLEERPAVIKGEGFNPSGGGFARIIVDGVAYTPEQVRSALQSQAAEIEREKRSSDMWAAEVKAAHARIAELENERDGWKRSCKEWKDLAIRTEDRFEAERTAKEAAEARLKDAVKVIEKIAEFGHSWRETVSAGIARAFISTTGGDSHG